MGAGWSSAKIVRMQSIAQGAGRPHLLASLLSSAGMLLTRRLTVSSSDPARSACMWSMQATKVSSHGQVNKAAASGPGEPATGGIISMLPCPPDTSLPLVPQTPTLLPAASILVIALARGAAFTSLPHVGFITATAARGFRLFTVTGRVILLLPVGLCNVPATEADAAEEGGDGLIDKLCFDPLAEQLLWRQRTE